MIKQDIKNITMSKLYIYDLFLWWIYADKREMSCQVTSCDFVVGKSQKSKIKANHSYGKTTEHDTHL